MPRLPLGLDVWEVKPDYVVLRAGEAQVDRLAAMGYPVEQLRRPSATCPTFATAEAAAGYHSAASLEQDLRQLAADDDPDIAELQRDRAQPRGPADLGAAHRRAARRQPASSLFMGCHHAREWIAVEVPVPAGRATWSSNADDRPGRGAGCAAARSGSRPMVNPDGHEYSRTQNRLWRKNRRPNPDGSIGVDPNRNYGYMWGTLNVNTSSHVPRDETYVGPRAFSEPETRAVRDLVGRELFARRHHLPQLLAADPLPVGLHRRPDRGRGRPRRDGDARRRTMQRLIKGVHGKVYTPQQSSELYPTAGDTTDWTYGVYGIPSFTIELRPRTVAEGGFILPPTRSSPPGRRTGPRPSASSRRSLGRHPRPNLNLPILALDGGP